MSPSGFDPDDHDMKLATDTQPKQPKARNNDIADEGPKLPDAPSPKRQQTKEPDWPQTPDSTRRPSTSEPHAASKRQTSTHTNQRRALKNQRRGRSGFLVVLLLLLIASVAYGILNTNAFELQQIIVQGNGLLSESDVIAQLSAPLGQNVLRLNLSQLFDNLLNHPYIADAVLHRRFPNILVVQITERQPLAVLTYHGSYLVIDEQGVILEISSTMIYPQCPLVNGQAVTTFSAGVQLQTEDAFSQETMYQILRELKANNCLGLISEIDMTDIQNMQMVSTDGVILRLGQSWDIPEKLRWVNAVLQDIRALGYAGGVIDLSSAKNPIYRKPDSETTIADDIDLSDDSAIPANADTQDVPSATDGQDMVTVPDGE